MRRRAVLSIATAAVTAAVIGGGGVMVGTRAAAQPHHDGIEQQISALIDKMTTQEKLEQLQLLSDGQITDADAKAGVGSVFSLTDPALINHYQHVAVEQSRLHIPILFAYDTIHGYRTIFPVPLAAASSFDPSVARSDATIGARESATVGIKQVYSPMLDVSHEPRWGRIVEGNGEDPYLGSVMGVARVQGDQGSDYSAPDKVVSSLKHYVAYGQPEGGREYNTTDMSEQRLRNVYLAPFKAAIDAGAGTVMCSFNAINGVPGCANKYTETDILKHQWGFDGFIESDYTAIAETRACPGVMPAGGPCGHGTAADGPEAAANALNAGTDSEMVSTNIRDYGAQLLAQHRISMNRLDDAVRRILRIKFRAGLFAHPYVDQAKAVDPASFVTASDRAAARKAAGESMVLLKNDNNALPLDPSKKTALIGPLGDSQHDMLGPWWGQGRDEDAVSLYQGMQKKFANLTYTPACTMSHAEPPDAATANDCTDTSGFPAAVAAARAADQVVLALGETREMGGEAEARTSLDLPGQQQELINEVAATGKPFTVVLFNSRPLTLSDVAAKSPAILEAWFPGIEAGNAVTDVLTGDVNPGGKLPVTFPQRLGQVPIYYNHEPTGRPCDPTQKYNSRYRDLNSCDPLYPFGYGLSYTTFDTSGLTLDKTSVPKNGSVHVSFTITNTGSKSGDDVAQLYLHDPVASISQPVRRLRGFERVTLARGESTTVHFTIDKSDFGFYDNQGKFVVEPGEIDLYAGDSSTATMMKSFTVQ
ncbi:MAG TPA: beta-glucosidase BglX [Jatrophihabitans sp.]|jgi:beta-glucosidase